MVGDSVGRSTAIDNCHSQSVANDRNLTQVATAMLVMVLVEFADRKVRTFACVMR